MMNARTPIVLIVDDTESNIDILVEVLGDEYDVMVATDGESALASVRETAPDLVLLDVIMPGPDGYEVCRILKEDPSTAHIPIVFLTSLNEERDEARGLSLGAADFITKPFNAELVRARVRNHLELKRHRDHLEDMVAERTRELALTQEVTIESMASLAEYRDPETGGHIKRTQHYVRALADQLRDHPKFQAFLTPETIDLLYKSAPLHDIGKVAVPDGILLKPGKLTPEEFEIMKRHTEYGRDAMLAAKSRLGTNSFLALALEIAEFHQERWDGSGYPHGLSGEAIPISGRLMAVADVYDALISKRVYKEPIPHEEAVRIILEGRDTLFDPDVVDAFQDIEGRFRTIALQYADFEEERRALGGGASSQVEPTVGMES